MKTKTKCLARSAIFAAVATALVCLCAVFPSGRLALIAIAGLCSALALIHCGGKWAAGVFAVSAVLSFLISPGKGNALLYASFFGYYPALKSLFERIHSRIAGWIAKFAVLNVAFAALWFLARAVLFEGVETPIPLPLLWVGINVVFFLYDIGLSRLISVYIRNFAGKMK